MLKMWYVSKPFDVVCVIDSVYEDADENAPPVERPRPLLAVDFGHAVWLEHETIHVDGAEVSNKRLRFVSFPPVDFDDEDYRKGWDSGKSSERETEGQVRTLEVPEELDMDSVETINIDQSQGAIILSVSEGQIFILCYE